MTDFSQPSSDGVLPPGFMEWEWGVSYTVRPPGGHPLSRGREYVITVSVRRMLPDHLPFQTFGPMYRRALRIVTARGDELEAEVGHPPLHRRIVSHGWRSVEIDAKRIATAFVMMGLLWPDDGQPLPAGELMPGEQQLLTAGGVSLDMLRHQAPQRAPEVYLEFDHRGETSSHRQRIMTFAYAERVAAAENFSFERVVARAEHRARFHRNLVVGGTAAHDPLRIVRREWFLVHETDLVTVHIYFEV
jgi:hypothetical protein